MTEPVNYWNAPRGTTMHTCADGEWVSASDYARLEQEYAELAERYGKLQVGEGHITHRVIAERDAALKLLARCQEHLDPHRDAVLWGEVCDAFKAKP